MGVGRLKRRISLAALPQHADGERRDKYNEDYDRNDNQDHGLDIVTDAFLFAVAVMLSALANTLLVFG